MNPEQIVEALFGPNPRYPRPAVQAALDQWPAVLPLLLERLGGELNAVRAGTELEPEGRGSILALHLLGHKGERRGWPLLQALCMLPSDDFGELAGGIMVEDLAAVLDRCCPGPLAELEAIYRAQTAGELVRWAAGKAMQSGVAQGKYSRADLQAALVYAVENEPADTELATSARFELLSMRPVELADKVRELAERGLVIADEVSAAPLEEQLKPNARDWADLRERWRSEAEDFAPKDLHDPQRWWAFFAPEAGQPQTGAPGGGTASAASAAMAARMSAAQAAAQAAKKKQRNKAAKQARKSNRKK